MALRSPLDVGRALAERYVALADTCAWRFYQRAPLIAPIDDCKSIARIALVEACSRWPEYCREHDYDHRDHSYLVAFLKMRIDAALLDQGAPWITSPARPGRR